MKSQAESPQQYLDSLPEDRKKAIADLRKVILKNLPAGFSEVMGYGMLGYVVPHTLYPEGYHCDPKQPLPFINVASQKNFIAMYHMGLYAKKDLLDWFIEEYKKITNKPPDMGKSCIRFKKPEQIPYPLIGELVSKINLKEWIDIYELNWKK